MRCRKLSPEEVKLIRSYPIPARVHSPALDKLIVAEPSPSPAATIGVDILDPTTGATRTVYGQEAVEIFDAAELDPIDYLDPVAPAS